MVAVILGREFAVTVLRSIAHARGQALPASPLGKVKMVAQVAAILILILGQGHMRGFFVLGQVALWIATIAALVSAVDYSRRINALLAAKPDAPPDAGRGAAAPGDPPRAIASALDARSMRCDALACRFGARVLLFGNSVEQLLVVRQRFGQQVAACSSDSAR